MATARVRLSGRHCWAARRQQQPRRNPWRRCTRGRHATPPPMQLQPMVLLAALTRCRYAMKCPVLPLQMQMQSRALQIQAGMSPLLEASSLFAWHGHATLCAPGASCCARAQPSPAAAALCHLSPCVLSVFSPSVQAPATKAELQDVPLPGSPSKPSPARLKSRSSSAGGGRKQRWQRSLSAAGVAAAVATGFLAAMIFRAVLLQVHALWCLCGARATCEGGTPCSSSALVHVCPTA